MDRVQGGELIVKWILSFIALFAIMHNDTVAAQGRYEFKCLERAEGKARVFSRIFGAAPDVFPTKADYPWMVSLSVKGVGGARAGSQCGGALIDTDLVVTAAHCFVGHSFVVRQIAEDGSPRGDIRTIKSVRKHPQYSTSQTRGNDYDVALVRLDRPFDISPSQLPVIQSPRSSFSNYFGQPKDCVRVIGWGNTRWNARTKKTEGASDRLLAADIRVWHEKECSEAYPNATTMSEKICAGYPKGKIDSCNGDSGGPLFAKGGVTGIRLVGIVSYGSEQCGLAGAPGVYARLSALLDWIRRTAKTM